MMRAEFRELAAYGASLDGPDRREFVHNLAVISPEVLGATLAAAVTARETGQLAGLGDLGFIDKITDFIKDAAQKTKEVVNQIGDAAAPWVSMIPGLGPIAALGTAAINGDPELYRAQQQQANAVIGQFANAMRDGQITPETVALARQEGEAKAKVARLKARLAAAKKDGRFLNISPTALGFVTVGVLAVGGLFLMKK